LVTPVINWRGRISFICGFFQIAIAESRPTRFFHLSDLLSTGELIEYTQCDTQIITPYQFPDVNYWHLFGILLLICPIELIVRYELTMLAHPFRKSTARGDGEPVLHIWGTLNVVEVIKCRTPQINPIASLLAPQWRWRDGVSFGITRPSTEENTILSISNAMLVVIDLFLDNLGKFMGIDRVEIRVFNSYT
jgi:hypothetical protein